MSSIRFIGQLLGFAFLLVGIARLSGCAASQPPAAQSNQILAPQDESARRVLDASQQEEAIAAMRSVAEGHTPVSPPAAAPSGRRWADLHASVIEAATEREMAVFGRIETERGVRYSLGTVDGRPAVLDITRLHDDRVYMATAKVGRFGDEDAEAALLEALDKHMRQFGRKRAVNDG